MRTFRAIAKDQTPIELSPQTGATIDATSLFKYPPEFSSENSFRKQHGIRKYEEVIRIKFTLSSEEGDNVIS